MAELDATCREHAERQSIRARPYAATPGCCGPRDAARSLRGTALRRRAAATRRRDHRRAGRRVRLRALREATAERSDAPGRPLASLGCGVPTAVAALARGRHRPRPRLGRRHRRAPLRPPGRPTGRAIGLDMTDEMLDLARANAAEAGVAERRLPPGPHRGDAARRRSVDVVITNCVINLSADKRKVLAEAARVLQPGGRFAVSDVIADPDMDEATRADMAAWTGCIAGALTEAEFERALAAAGFGGASRSRETHRVHGTRPRRSSARASLACDARSISTTPRCSTATGSTTSGTRGGRPRARPRAVAAARAEERELVLLALVLADGRRGADHDQVLRARRRPRLRGGGDLPRHPAGRRGPAHAVLRALPG